MLRIGATPTGRQAQALVLSILVLLLTSSLYAQSSATKAVGSDFTQGAEDAQESPRQLELDGCLDLHDGELPKLTLFRSEKFYRVEPREGLLTEHPLAFAQNNDALVHVAGHFGPGPDTYDPDHSPVFVVDAIQQLAPTCDVHESLAELQRRVEKPKATAPAAVSFEGKTPVVIMKGELLLYEPAAIEIRVGQTVEWKNSSAEVHTVTADPHQAGNARDVKLPQGAQPFDSGYLNPGQAYRHTFQTPGTYRYVCTLHEIQHMIGRVIVKR